MVLNITEQNGQLSVYLEGQLSFMDAEEFKQVFSAMDKSTISDCIFDLSKLESIDSSGLGMLVKVNDISFNQGYSVSLKGAQDRVLKVLKLSKMENFFEIS